MTGKGPCVAESAFPSYCAAGDSAPLLRTRRRSLPAGEARGTHGAVGGVTPGWGWGDRTRRRVKKAGHSARARDVVSDCGIGISPGRASGGRMDVRDGGSPVSLGEVEHTLRADVDQPPAGDRTPGGTEARRRRRAPAGCRGDGEGGEAETAPPEPAAPAGGIRGRPGAGPGLQSAARRRAPP